MPIVRAEDQAIGLNPDDPIAGVINTLVTSFRPLYAILVVTCIWSAMLVPLFVILIFFSTPEMRRKPIFIGNVFVILVGILFAGVVIGLTMTIFLDPLVPPNAPLYLTFASFLAFGHILIESVLLIRLWAVYPFKATPRKIFYAIFIPILLLKIGRVTNAIIYLVNLSKQVDDGERTLSSLQKTWIDFPNYRIEWFLQVADNGATSGLFLAKLNKGRAFRKITRGRFPAILDYLFWIAVYNFVIPVILSIAELIVVWTTTDISHSVPVCIVNLYVQIIGVLLATVWAEGSKWQDEQKSIRSGVQVTIERKTIESEERQSRSKLTDFEPMYL